MGIVSQFALHTPREVRLSAAHGIQPAQGAYMYVYLGHADKYLMALIVTIANHDVNCAFEESLYPGCCRTNQTATSTSWFQFAAPKALDFLIIQLAWKKTTPIRTL